MSQSSSSSSSYSTLDNIEEEVLTEVNPHLGELIEAINQVDILIERFDEEGDTTIMNNVLSLFERAVELCKKTILSFTQDAEVCSTQTKKRKSDNENAPPKRH